MGPSDRRRGTEQLGRKKMDNNTCDCRGAATFRRRRTFSFARFLHFCGLLRRAQETIDAAKITCNQLMFGRIADSRVLPVSRSAPDERSLPSNRQRRVVPADPRTRVCERLPTSIADDEGLVSTPRYWPKKGSAPPGEPPIPLRTGHAIAYHLHPTEYAYRDPDAPMANDEHIALLEQGVNAWNAWHAANRDIRPDLSK